MSKKIAKDKKIQNFNNSKDWSTWVGKEIEKFSGKPFKSTFKTGTVKMFTVNQHSGKEAFLMDDESIVDCFQCKLKTI